MKIGISKMDTATVKKLHLVLGKVIEKLSDDKFDPHNVGWSIILHENGKVEVWHGVHGDSTS